MVFVTWYRSTQILQAMVSWYPSDWALEPEGEILMFMWSLGPVKLRGLGRFADSRDVMNCFGSSWGPFI